MEKTESRHFVAPRKAAVWTVIAVGVIAAITIFGEWINDSIGIGPGETNLVKYLLMLITGIVWLCWLAFFSRLRGRFLLTLGFDLFVRAVLLFLPTGHGRRPGIRSDRSPI